MNDGEENTIGRTESKKLIFKRKINEDLLRQICKKKEISPHLTLNLIENRRQEGMTMEIERRKKSAERRKLILNYIFY